VEAQVAAVGLHAYLSSLAVVLDATGTVLVAWSRSIPLWNRRYSGSGCGTTCSSRQLLLSCCATATDAEASSVGNN
jgi:hypothetical protein